MLKKILGAGVTSFIGVSAIALPMHFGVRAEDAFMLIGPMGASAALVFGAPEAPFAQPRNVVFGQMICAAIGTVRRWCRVLLRGAGIARAQALVALQRGKVWVRCRGVIVTGQCPT